MVEGGEHSKRIAKIRAEWDRAEEDIKLAEQVCHKVVWPSVKELRYAGRRVIDALHAIANNLPAEEVNKLFQDAEYDCHRSRHDAIDAATSTIAIHLEAASKKIGYGPVLDAFPQFPVLRTRLNSIREKIKESRANRENRELIYSAIECDSLSEIVTLYNQFQANEDIMRSIAKRNRWTIVISVALGVLGVAVGVISLALC